MYFIMWMGSRSYHLVQKPPALGIVLVGSEVISTQEPDCPPMKCGPVSDDFTRFPNPVEKVANLKFSEHRGVAGRMTDWAMSWALLVLARCSQSEAQALRARSQVQAPRIPRWNCRQNIFDRSVLAVPQSAHVPEGSSGHFQKTAPGTEGWSQRSDESAGDAMCSRVRSMTCTSGISCSITSTRAVENCGFTKPLVSRLP